MNRPKRKVVKCVLRGGSSFLANFKYHFWELHLECGHVVERRIRWKPDPKREWQRRGFSAMHHGPGLDRLPEEPKSARCEECGGNDA